MPQPAARFSFAELMHTEVGFRVIIEIAPRETQHLANPSEPSDPFEMPLRFGIVQTGSTQASQCFFLDG